MNRFILTIFILIPTLLFAATDVYWEPVNPQPGQNFTIYYNHDDRGVLPVATSPVYLHIGYNDWQSTNDFAMSETGDYHTYTYSVPNDAESINFVFTNSAQDSWDNNSGINWDIPLNHVQSPTNPKPNESLTLTLSNITKAGSVYWYIKTYDYKQLPIEEYRPASSIISNDHHGIESPMLPTGTPNQYSITFPAFNTGKQVVDKIYYTINYNDESWLGKMHEIIFHHDENNISFSSPAENTFINKNTAVSIAGTSSNIDELKIWGGQQLLTEITGTTFNYLWNPSQTHPETCFGKYWITIQGTNTSSGEVCFSRRLIDIEANPVQISYSGILNDGVSVNGNQAVIALYAPGKEYISISGNFNQPYIHGKMMNNNGDGWWWYSLNLSPGKYSYQYEVKDDNFGWTKRLADPYSKELIWNVPGTENESGDINLAKSVFYIGTSDFAWTDHYYTPPSKEKFIIYETHIGDFSGEDNFGGDYSDMLAKVESGYFNDLGINAVEIMPLHAFGGEMSWGYNPAFYLAPPNCYGTVNELKTLINSFHNHGIGVILDVVFNHTYGSSSTFQLFHAEGYYGAEEWRTHHDFTNDPYYKNGDSEWGYPLDHSKNKTRDLIDETLAWYVSEYHIDGFRFDHPHEMIWDSYDYGLQHYSWTVKQINNDLLLIAEEDNPTGINNSNFDSQWDFSAYHTFKENLFQIGDWGNIDNIANGIYHDGHNNHYGPVKYTESHDESRIIYEGMEYQNFSKDFAVKKSKLGAAIIFTCTGIPMIYHGQEFGQNAPKNGTDPQPLQWDTLNTDSGADLFNYYKTLIELRKNSEALTDWKLETRQKFFTEKSIVYWRNGNKEKYVIVANFDNQNHSLNIEFPNSGKWIDVITEQEINIESSWYSSYPLPASEARIFKFIPEVYVPGTHNDWDLDNDNLATRKENFGGDIIYYGKTIQTAVDNEFAIVYGDWSNKWCNGYWVTDYDTKHDFGWSGNNAIWKNSPNTYIHLNIQNPADAISKNIPLGIMKLSEIPANILSVTTDYFNGTFLRLHITTDNALCNEEKIYIRVAPDGNFANDLFIRATGSGNDYYAEISDISFLNYIEYYALSTTLTYAEDNNLDNYTDLMTINYNTNNGQNYKLDQDQSLAVELSKFNATLKNGGVEITWTTQSETNNLGFNVFRKSSSDEDFIKINPEIIRGAGSSSISHKYTFYDMKIICGEKYFYKLEDIEYSGKRYFSHEISINIPESTTNLPEQLCLSSLYPNPFNPTLNIKFEVPERDWINISMYNLKGQKVEQLLNNEKNKGIHKLQWNASAHSSGIYFIKLSSKEHCTVKSCVLIK